MDPLPRMVELKGRGKRKRKEPRAAKTLQSGGPRPRGRPMMTASALKIKKHKRASPKSAHPVNKQSWLERLPVELLEQIFLHSLATNMALASPSLCKALSKESIYRVLILFAFFEDDERHPVEEKHFAPATYRVLGAEERLRLQKGVLNSRWCTLARVRHCLPTLTRLLIQQEWHRHRERECKQQQDLVSQDGHDQQRQRVSMVPPLDDEDAVNRFINVDDSVHAIYQSVEAFLAMGHFYRYISYVDYLPNRLVNPVSWHNSTEPNSDNAQPLDFLKLLYSVLGSNFLVDAVSLRCSIEPVIRERNHDAGCSVDVPSLCRGIDTAVRERNHDALDLLLEIYHSFNDNNTDDQGVSTLNHLPVGIIHRATRQGDDSEWILRLLARYSELDGTITLPRDDKVLTKWALAQSKAGSQFATWLLEVLGAEGADMDALWLVKPGISY
ncbi:hypothetical protein GJ744_000429 [Endocarpon pusillum]|uniref:F-box domain-containing protein n=1 Tax=Endocarpon pusillum TaxID=364733 RepID=A0A8H7AAV0_9EURO|nr:hypothetical protein GJ744_000429 [Endocarpon pusillum]